MTFFSARLTVIAFAATMLVYAWLPTQSVGRATAYLLVLLLVAYQAVGGYRRVAASRRRPWAFLCSGLVLLLAADTGLLLWQLATGTPPPFPTPVHLLHPLGTAAVGLGLTSMVRRGSRPDRGALVDALLVTTSTTLAATVSLAGPLEPQLAGSSAGLLHVLLQGTAHLFVLVSAIRFALTAPWSHPAARLLVGGGLALPVAAAALGALSLRGHGMGSAADLGWLATYLLLSQALCHPSAGEVAAPRSPRAGSGAGRLLLVAAVLVLLPASQLARASSTPDLLMTAGTAVLLALVTIRMGLLLRAAQRAQGRRVQLEQERGQRRLEALLQHASDVLLILDARNCVSHASPSAIELLGEDPRGWSGDQLLDHVHVDDREQMRRGVEESLAEAEGQATRFAARLLERDGRARHAEVVVANLRDDPAVRGTVLTFHDITERVELERRLRHLAFHDALTGLSNRELFQDRLMHALARARRTQRRVAVLVCDLDDFKDVNDTHGHATGDALLVHLAERLRKAARTSDTIARLGGDEFAIVCEDLGRTRDAIDVARRVLSATSQPVMIEERALTVGVSVGIAVDDGHRSADELQRDADIALYEAKADGKQRWALHEESMTVRSQQRLQLATDLARAVEEGRIETAYQPIMALDDECIVGVEVLARWEHPEHGWVPPGEFIAIAEQSGLIIELGDIVLDSALETLRGWLDERPDLMVRLGVNVSGRQMRDPGLPQRIARKLTAWDIPAPMLVLELTESVMVDEADLAIEVMHELRQLGVRFSVDDFGTGYSSLAYLSRLPVSILKTDRAFVHALGVEEGAEDLIRAIVQMARSLHLDVVAEGVETEAQHRALLDLGCTLGQGYRFAYPVAASVLGPRLLDPATRVATRDLTRPAEQATMDTREQPAHAGPLRSR